MRIALGGVGYDDDDDDDDDWSEKFLEGNHDDGSDHEYRHAVKVVSCFLGVALVFVILGVLAITRG